MKKRNFFYGVAALFCASTFFYSCKSDDEKLGINNGNGPEVTIIDTFSVYTRTVPEDSFATYRLSVNVLGAINSSTFGKSKAEIAMNFALPNINNFSFPAGSKVDSVFLVLQYAGSSQYNGNLSTPLNIKAYEITERLYRDSVYYSTKKYPFNGTPISNYTGTFNVSDSVKVEYFGGIKETQAPQLRLRLDNLTIGSKIINGSSVNFASNSAFQDYINGIIISGATLGNPSDDGVAAFFDLFSGLSGIHVFYNDSLFVQFPIDDQSAVANTYSNDFTGTPIQNQINNPTNYDIGYLQSMAGSRILVEIPGLQKFNLDGNYAIVGATLDFSPEIGTIGAGFAQPSRLLLLSRDSNNKSSLVVDAITDPDIYNGNYSSSRFRYSFNIPRHVQYMFDEYTKNGVNLNKGFFLRIPADNPVTATRLIVNTQKGIAQGMKFKLHVIKVR